MLELQLLAGRCRFESDQSARASALNATLGRGGASARKAYDEILRSSRIV